MFIRRTFHFESLQGKMLPNQLKAQDLALMYRADSVIHQAHTQANQIIEQAKQQAQKHLEQAEVSAQEQVVSRINDIEQQIWAQANEALTQIRDSEARRWEEIEANATHVVLAVLRQWCSSLDEQQKLHIVIQQVIAAQKPITQGTLVCHPEQQHWVQSFLEDKSFLAWRVEGDADLSLGEVRLEVATGHFCCRWTSIVEAMNAVFEPSQEPDSEPNATPEAD